MNAQRLPQKILAALWIGAAGMFFAASHAEAETPSAQILSEQNPQDAEAQYALGEAYDKGCKKAEAVKWFRLAAEQWHTEAQLKLGMAYLGQGDVVEGIRWVTRSAEQDNIKAALVLGSFYSSGSKPDYAEALEWVKPFAQEGNVEAQSFLGESIYRHDAATAQDLEESRKWLRLAAEQGYADAQVLLGEIYMHGEEGLKADKVEGVRWFRLAAAQENIFAKLWLGLAYLKGDGVEQNRETAREWLKQTGMDMENMEKVFNALEAGYEFERYSRAMRKYSMRKYH